MSPEKSLDALASEIFFQHAHLGAAGVVALRRAAEWMEARTRRAGRRYPLSETEIETARRMRAEGVSLEALSARFGVSESQVEKCVQGIDPDTRKARARTSAPAIAPAATSARVPTTTSTHEHAR